MASSGLLGSPSVPSPKADANVAASPQKNGWATNCMVGLPKRPDRKLSSVALSPDMCSGLDQNHQNAKTAKHKLGDSPQTATPLPMMRRRREIARKVTIADRNRLAGPRRGKTRCGMRLFAHALARQQFVFARRSQTAGVGRAAAGGLRAPDPGCESFRSRLR